jgi:outer membrane protein TolC
MGQAGPGHRRSVNGCNGACQLRRRAGFCPAVSAGKRALHKEPLQTGTSSAPVADGAAQHFRSGRDVEGEWWRLYGSHKLNALILRALDANPNLQSAMAALRVANENVYAQQGKFFPLIQANFNPSRQRQSDALAPIPSPFLRPTRLIS